MDYETNKYESQAATDFGNVTATAEDILDKGTEACGKAGQAVGEAYEKTTRMVKETYEKAKSYSTENPGKTILVALGIGVGIGLLLRANCSHR
jgi:ElaB/YqjD/DUF883 family membrane-anchored ribosome-binding protein